MGVGEPGLSFEFHIIALLRFFLGLLGMVGDETELLGGSQALQNST